MINNQELRANLENQEYWDLAAERLLLKPRLNLEDKLIIEQLVKNHDVLVAQIMNGTYIWSVANKICINKSGTTKKRVVYLYSIQDRLVLGVLYRALSDCSGYTRYSNCYSYKKGISTVGAVKVLKKSLSDNPYGVKLDISAYFNSVSKGRLQEMLDELFTGPVKDTLERLYLDDIVMYKGKMLTEYKALIPGTAIASFFANYCLINCDKYFYDNHIPYARYSDDIIVLGKSQEELQGYLDIISEYLAKYDLKVNPKKYVWFTPEDTYFNFLGLKFDKQTIDIADHSKHKIKKQIHRWCRKGRIEMEKYHEPFEKVARQIIRRLNYKNFKCYIENENTFGWCHYAFRYINTVETLKEIDFYTRDTLRAMKTGKHNFGNIKAISDDEFKELGWISLVDLYNLYHSDFDYYLEVIDLL